MLFTKHVFFGHVACSDFPPFPTISHDFPAFPRYPPPAHCRHPGHRLHGCIALPREGPGLHVSPSGNEKSGRVTRHESGLSTSTTANRRNTVKTAGRTACLGYWGHETRETDSKVHWPSDISFWSEPGPLQWISRITSHETRITAFSRVLRPSGGEKCRLVTACLCAVERLWRGWSGCCGEGGAARSGMERHIAPEPVSPLRPRFTVGLMANAKGTHAEKEERSIFR